VEHFGNAPSYLGPTLIYLLIALPLVVGVIWRLRTLRYVGHAMAIAACVFGTVALGVVVYHYNDRHSPLESYPGYSAVEAYVATWLPHASVQPPPHARARGSHGSYPVFRPAPPAQAPGLARILTATIMVLAFAVVGALIALLGPVVAGYTGTMALNAYFHHHHIGDIFLWRQFFDAIKINHLALEVTCLIVGSLVSTTHSVVTSVRGAPGAPGGAA
jgi:hypothetical protein